MKKLLNELNVLGITTNEQGDKVEQKQSRAIKSHLIDGVIADLKDTFEIMYDESNNPVIVLDNGLIIGFDFTVKKLDSKLSAEPTPKTKKAK